jgi:hypothetical protein
MNILILQQNYSYLQKSRIEPLSSITIGYLNPGKSNKDSNNWKRMRNFLGSGCTATLINHSLIKTLDTIE